MSSRRQLDKQMKRRIGECLDCAPISKRRIAKRIGVSYTWLYNVIRESHTPPYYEEDRLKRLAGYFDWSLHVLLKGSKMPDVSTYGREAVDLLSRLYLLDDEILMCLLPLTMPDLTDKQRTHGVVEPLRRAIKRANRELSTIQMFDAQAVREGVRPHAFSKFFITNEKTIEVRESWVLPGASIEWKFLDILGLDSPGYQGINSLKFVRVSYRGLEFYWQGRSGTEGLIPSLRASILLWELVEKEVSHGLESIAIVGSGPAFAALMIAGGSRSVKSITLRDWSAGWLGLGVVNFLANERTLSGISISTRVVAPSVFSAAIRPKHDFLLCSPPLFIATSPEYSKAGSLIPARMLVDYIVKNGKKLARRAIIQASKAILPDLPKLISEKKLKQISDSVLVPVITPAIKKTFLDELVDGGDVEVRGVLEQAREDQLKVPFETMFHKVSTYEVL